MTVHRTTGRGCRARRARHHHRRVRRRHGRRGRPRRPALQAADRRLRRPAAAVAVRPRPGAAGHRMTAVPAGAERGAVTAELALALPLLVAVTVGLVWLLAVGAAQSASSTRARETARAVARGDDEAAAVARGQRVAPEGAAVTVSTATATRCASTVVARADGPGWAVRLPAGGHARGRGRRRPPRSRRERPGRRARGGAACSPSPAWRLLLLVGAALGVVAAMVHAHRPAQSAADLAALAGAPRPAARWRRLRGAGRHRRGQRRRARRLRGRRPRRRGRGRRWPARGGSARPATCRRGAGRAR